MKVDQIALLASGVIQDKKGRILFLKRSKTNKTFGGYWQLPEGKMEPNESPTRALGRELKEELSGSIHNIQLRWVLPIPAKFKGATFLLIKVVFTASHEGKIQLSADHIAYRRVSKEKAISSFKLVPGTKEILQQI